MTKIQQVIQENNEGFEKKFPIIHEECEDCWYSCPLSEGGCCDESQKKECNCGEENRHRKVKQYLSSCQERLVQAVREEVEGMKLGGHKDDDKRIYAGGYDQAIDDILNILK